MQDLRISRRKPEASTCRVACVDYVYLQHFITDCPDREKPKEGYICRICNEVCVKSVTAALWYSYLNKLPSPVTSFAIAPSRMQWVTQVGGNLAKATSAERAVANCTTSRTVPSRTRLAPAAGKANAAHPKRLRVRTTLIAY